MTKTNLYLAYGSNLNRNQMKMRCPTAEIVDTATMKDWRLMFRGERGAVATIEPSKGDTVPVLVWRLQPKDERSLDKYEGFPYLYRKEYVTVSLNGEKVSAMVYIMNETGHPYGLPSIYYLNSIQEGYLDAGFDLKNLYVAMKNSKEEAKNEWMSL